MSFLPTSQILTLASSLLVLAIVVSPLQGREPILLEKGKLLGEATFEGGELSGDWKASGEVSVADGQLHWVSEKGKASLQSTFQNEEEVTLGDHILEYTFRYDEELDRTQIVYNDEFGHAIIIALSPEYHHVRKWPDQDVLHRFEEFPDASGSSLQPGELYTVTVEMRDSEFLVRLNDTDFLFGENYRAGRAKHRLVVSFDGGQGTLESIRLWEGTPKASWPKERKDWESKKEERLSWVGKGPEDFGSRFRIAGLRRQLRENDDPDYAAIVNETSAYLEEIRALYPFYGGKPTRQNVAAKKEARLHDERYQAMLKHLDSLEKRELAYFQAVDSSLLDSTD